MSNAKNLATFLQSGGSIAGDANFDSNTLFVDSSANAVGIGTSSPSGAFTSAGGRSFFFSGDLYGIGIAQSSGQANYAYLGSDASGNLQVSDTQGNQIATFTQDNKVGIGTSSPSANLEVNTGAASDPVIQVTNSNAAAYRPSIRVDNQHTGGRSYRMFSTADGDGVFGGGKFSIYDDDAGSSRLTIDNGGSVGIGESSPDRKLHVKSGADNVVAKFESTDAVAAIEFADSAGSAEIGNAGNDLVFYPAGVEKVRIDSSGNVGINTSSPNAKLTVNTGNRSTDGKGGTLCIGGDADTTGGLTNNTRKFGFITVPHYQNAEGNLWLVGADAGTSSNDIFIGGAFTGYNAATSIRFNTAANSTTSVGTERMRIDSSGNVGIGTSSPSSLTTLSASGGATILELNRSSTNTTGAVGTINFTASDGHSVANIYAIGDGNNEGAHLVFKTTSAAGEYSPYGSNTFERMRITSGGRIGINETSPDSMLHIKGDDPTGDGASITLQVDNNNTTDRTGIIRSGNNHSGTTSAISFETVGGVENGEMRFYTRDGSTVQERMRIDSSGRLLIDGNDVASAANGAYVDLRGGDGTSISTYRIGTSTRTHHAFYNGTSSSRSLVGTIQTSGSSTSYNTTSDYRLKENVTDITDGIERVKQLNPSRFNFIADADTTVDGFLAHEVSDIVPEAVSGEKDAMRDEEYEVTPAVLDDDGNVVTEAVMGTRSVPDYQGIDQSKLVPLLTAALQEAIAKIETLETKVATLEGA